MSISLQAVQTISPLRQRMLDDMRMRKLAPKTQSGYIRAVRNLARFLGRSPDTATPEDLRRYQLHLVDRGTSAITINTTITALKFFFEVTVRRADVMDAMESVRVPHELPVVLSREEVARLIRAASNLKYQAALSVACGHDELSYNSCRNRHCPKCQASAAQRWLEARQAELLPVEYYHVVFTLPEEVAQIAYYNKAVVYRLLFEVAAETLCTIAADERHPGAQIGATLVLHTWGSALTHHPYVHGIVPGGGLSKDGERWVACRRGFFLPVRVLSRLFRRRFLEELDRTYRAGLLQFFGQHASLAQPAEFAAWLEPLRGSEWVVYAKRPFAGPAAVLAYLSRYTHRVAISNSRLVAMDGRGVTFRWKDYRAKGATRRKTMTLDADEFMRRILLHVLPKGFHRIRYYGLFANSGRRENIERVRRLLHVVPDLLPASSKEEAPQHPRPIFVCPDCGAEMIVIDVVTRTLPIRAPPALRIAA